jgi:hypothetical protein
MRLLKSPALLLSAFALSASALNTTCSTFPSYNTTTQSTSPFTLLASSATAPINGTAASFVSFTNDGVDRYGFVRNPVSHVSDFLMSPAHVYGSRSYKQRTNP